MKISIDNVTKKFGERTVVDRLNLDVADGGLTVLLGPSGCGKTTTLRMLAGLEKIDSGEIYFDSNAVSQMSPKQRNVAMVFQDYGLYPHMSVLNNVTFPLKIANVPKSKREDIARSLLKRFGIDQLSSRKPGLISGGEKQRVSLARALVRHPSVLLMDEPLSNLDALLRVSMRLEIKKLHQDLQTTTIYVTHDQVEAMSLGTAIAVMRDGTIEQCDTPAQIYHDPTSLFVGMFVGSPTMNVLRVEIEQDNGTRLKGDGINLALDTEKLQFLADGTSDRYLLLGLRSEIFEIRDEFRDKSEGIKGKVQLTENLGQDNYIHVLVGDDQIIARIPSDRSYQPGQPVQLLPRTSEIYFFDSVTEKRIKMK